MNKNIIKFIIKTIAYFLMGGFCIGIWFSPEELKPMIILLWFYCFIIAMMTED